MLPKETKPLSRQLVSELKKRARETQRRYFEQGLKLKYCLVLEAHAKYHNFNNWNTAKAYFERNDHKYSILPIESPEKIDKIIAVLKNRKPSLYIKELWSLINKMKLPDFTKYNTNSWSSMDRPFDDKYISDLNKMLGMGCRIMERS